MRRYPMFNETGRQKSTQTVFGGVNLTDGITEGEWEDTQNLTTDNFPILSNRKRRALHELTYPEPNMYESRPYKVLSAVSTGNGYDAIVSRTYHLTSHDVEQVYQNNGDLNELSMIGDSTRHFAQREITNESKSAAVRFNGNTYGMARADIAGKIPTNVMNQFYRESLPTQMKNGVQAIANWPSLLSVGIGGFIANQIMLAPGDEYGNIYTLYSNYHEASWYDTHTPVSGDLRGSSVAGATVLVEKYNGSSWQAISAKTSVLLFADQNGAARTDYLSFFPEENTRFKVMVPNGVFDYGGVSGINNKGSDLASVLGLALTSEKCTFTWNSATYPDFTTENLDTWVGWFNGRRSMNPTMLGYGGIIIDNLDLKGKVYTYYGTTSLHEAVMIIQRSTNIKDSNPSILFACTNRLWTCADKGNEVMCSKLGDAFSWDAYEGISTDSWAATVGSEGKFTGGIAFDDTPIFFKRDKMYRVYVSGTGAHQLTEASVKGVQDGCGKSLAIVNNVLYWKSETEICAFSGSQPYSVSEVLGDLSGWSDAEAGTYKDKLYISMKNRAGEYKMFVYDTIKGIWIIEDDERARNFFQMNGNLYWFRTMEGANGVQDNLVQLDGEQSDAEFREEMVPWSAQTGPYSYYTTNQHYIDRISLRFTLAEGAHMSVFVSYDDGEWEHIMSLSGARTRTYTLPIRPHRCDHFRLKYTGEGDFKITNITKTTEEGSDVAW